MLWEFNNLLTPKYVFSEKIFSARTINASPSNLSDAHLSDDELTPHKKGHNGLSRKTDVQNAVDFLLGKAPYDNSQARF